VLRIPGFLNRKYSPACSVAVEYGPADAFRPTDFCLPIALEKSELRFPGTTRRVCPHKDTRSEQDWAWVCQQLAQGQNAGKVTHELASRRSDKPNPRYYAQRTIDVATARVWFLQGASIEDVIIMLEDRRRSELPEAICFARAREIALTARRMVARRKTA
jgi:hypothetical protein